MSRWIKLVGMARSMPRCLRKIAACGVLSLAFVAPAAVAQAPSVLTTVAGGGPKDVRAARANISEATSMVRASNGDIYLAGKRRVLKYDAVKQTVTVFAGTGFAGYTGDGGPATQATFRSPMSLALDPAEQYLYIGDSGSRVVRIVGLASGIIGTAVGTADTAPLKSMGAIAISPTGDVYIADPVRCMIFRRVDGLAFAFAGNGVCQGSIDGPGGNPSDDYPTDDFNRLTTALDASLGDMQYDPDRGHLYFVEKSRVRMIRSGSADVDALAGLGVSRWSIDGQGGDPADDFLEGADARTASIGAGAKLFVDRTAGSLLIAEVAPNPLQSGSPDVNVREVSLADVLNPFITTAAGPLQMISANGVARSAKGELYVMGRLSAGIRILQMVPGSFVVIAGNGIAGCGDGQLATDACLPGPVSLLVDAAANATILESSPAPVRQVDAATGIISTLSAPDLLFGQPGDFLAVVDGFYISDSATHQILLHDAYGSVIPLYGVADSQPGDPLGDGGPAAFATFNKPQGLARDAQGNLFVADSLNRRVRRIDAITGIVTTVAGDGTSCRSQFGSQNLPPNPRDGSPAVAACLDSPARLAFDLNGDLLVTEASGNRIRRIAAGADGLITGELDEIIQTIAGTSFAGYSGDGGEAIQARIGAPIGIAVAPNGDIYFSDVVNRVIRRIDGNTQVITTVAGTTGNGSSDSIDFGSDSTWTTIETGGIIGPAANYCLNAFSPPNCPAGATLWGYPGAGWGPDLSSIPGATWIWAPGLDGSTVGGDNATYAFTKNFHITGTPTFGSISVAADNAAVVLVNGSVVGANQSHGILNTFDITPFLVEGQNTIAVVAHNQPIGCPSCPYAQNPAGVVFGGSIRSSSVPGAPLNPLNTVLDTPMGVAVGEESGQHYLYFADSGLDRVLRIPITVNLPPPPVNISVANAQVAEGNSGSTQLTFDVTLSAPSTQAITVNYATADDTATTADNDYIASTGVVTFLPGETSKQVVVSVSGDTTNELAEKFFLNLSSPTGATLAQAQAVGTISNDDLVTISVRDEKTDEGDPTIGRSAEVTFTVKLSIPSSEMITVRYATADDTATTADNDYVSASGVLKFLPGETQKQVIVPVNGDTTYEADEQFFLDLSNPSGATIADAQGIGTIHNDDPLMIIVNETITVTDTPGVLPSAMLTIAENITVTDTPGVLPSAMLTIAENITVTDTPAVLPSAMLTISENITVTDTPSVGPQGGTQTLAGTDVLVQGRNRVGQGQPVTIHFANVIQAGFTYADPIPAPPPLPPNFSAHSAALDITTTAQISGPITICFSGVYPPRSRLLHHTSGAWADVTTAQTATQVCGQTSSLSPFVVGSFANNAPSLSMPGNITLEAASAAGAAVNYAATANDNEDGAVAAACAPISGSIFPLGTTTVSCTATDSDGAQAAGNFTVTVLDTTAPVLTLPANITVTATSATGANVSYAATATDSVSGSITPVCVPASGAVFAVGSTPVNCTASDAAGNSATGSFTVTVTALPQSGPPRLVGAIAAKGRDANGNYFLDLRLSNTGTGPANNVTFTSLVFRTLAGSGAVTYDASLSGALPMQVGSIEAGANRVVRIYVNLPATVTRFSITENGNLRDAGNVQMNFSLGQAVIP